MDKIEVLKYLLIVSALISSISCRGLSPTISDKGRKLAESRGGNVLSQDKLVPKKKAPTTTEDPFSFASEFEDNNEWGVESTIGDDDWGDFGSDGDFFVDEDLPFCDLILTHDEPCKNRTDEPPEVRYRDPIFSRLISQVWSDFQYKLNTEAALYGEVIDPLDVDSKLPEPIDIQQSSNMFTVDVKMNGIKVYGLSGIRMEDSSVTRNENLTDFKVKVVFAFDNLIVNGSYQLSGQFGWWNLDSQGEQLFEISMTNATLTYQMKMDSVANKKDWSALNCAADNVDNVLITEIRLPLEYSDVSFKFNNLGSFANTMVNTIGIYFLKTQEDMLVGEIRKAIKKNINSLIC